LAFRGPYLSGYHLSRAYKLGAAVPIAQIISGVGHHRLNRYKGALSHAGTTLISVGEQMH